MKRFCEIEIFDDDYEKVTFYTVRIEDATLTETDKFYKRFLENDNVVEYRPDFKSIITWIDILGNDIGAKEEFFRPENSGHALPPRDRMIKRYKLGTNIDLIERNRLRLYCVWISESVVLLLNGGIKEAQKNSDKGAEDIQSHFRQAEKIGKEITKMIIDKELESTFKKLEGDLFFFI